MINLVNSALSFVAFVIGLAIAIYTFYNTRERARQNKIKTEMDQIALDKARADYRKITEK